MFGLGFIQIELLISIEFLYAYMTICELFSGNRDELIAYDFHMKSQ